MSLLSPLQKANFYLKTIGLFKIPLIYYIGAKIIDASADRTVLRVPLNRRTKNHLGSMYFGALAIGADVTGAWVAIQLLRESKQKVSIVFKDLSAEFLMRPEGDVHFTCSDVKAIEQCFAATVADGERKNLTVKVIATVPTKTGDKPVATFAMTLSAKRASK